MTLRDCPERRLDPPDVEGCPEDCPFMASGECDPENVIECLLKDAEEARREDARDALREDLAMRKELGE
jgi:hypothetical protein